MRVGVIVPQGWTGEFDGWDPLQAWQRTRAVARQADELGFDSIWLYDHFHTVPRPTEEITFESFTTLAALGAITERVRLGHIVICAGFRNPALTAKMISTMDVHTGGRMELGIGAGWKRDEWDAYGYGFPGTKDRLANLEDGLQVISRMMEPGPATFNGEYASVQNAINVPQPLQRPRVPIMVGGTARRSPGASRPDTPTSSTWTARTPMRWPKRCRSSPPVAMRSIDGPTTSGCQLTSSPRYSAVRERGGSNSSVAMRTWVCPG